jgi:prepilin-type N-terminal cleavage/methylation domain-containing protein
MRLAAVRQRTARGHAGSDAGVTLLEVVVSMTIMSMLMSIFTVGVVQMYRSASRAEAISAAQSQAYIVFQRLDGEIRYASAISTEGTVGVDPYIEYLTTTGHAETCNQLRLKTDTAQLQRRTWVQGTTPGGWTRIASDVGAPAAPDKPFTFTTGNNFQTLQLHLVAGPAASGSRVTAETRVTFTALNTSRGADTKDVCTEGRGQ